MIIKSWLKEVTQKRPKLLLISAISLVAILSGLIIYLIFFHFSISKNWISYSNIYYGYSFSYDPENFIVEVDPYGANIGEDISISLDKVDLEKLDKNNLRKGFFSDFWRGVIPDHNYILWQLSFSKPRVFAGEELATLKKHCKHALFSNSAYLTCHNYSSSWIVPLGNQVFVIVSAPVSKDQRLIGKILGTLKINSATATYLSYPSKSVIEKAILTTQCSHHSFSSNNFDTCEQGLKDYEPYYIANSSKLLKTLMLTKPFSYCQVNLESFPNVPSNTCPYTSIEDLYDVHALGECDDHPLCNTPLPVKDVFSDTPVEKAKALNSVLTTMTAAGWKFFTRSSGSYALAAPVSWLMIEGEGGIQAPNSDSMIPFTTITLSDPKHLLSIVANDSASTPVYSNENTMVKTGENLGKFYCGRFAACNLIRYKSNNPIFKVPVYEYALVKLDQANFIKTPPQLLLYIYDTKNISQTNLKLADSIVKTLVFLTPDDP